MSTITTNEAPTKGGTIEDAIRQAQQETAETAAEPSAEPKQRVERKPTKYLVVEVMDSGLRVLGSYEVTGGQPAARLAAIESDPELKGRVLGDEPPMLAAIANFNPVKPQLVNREPKIQA